VDKRYMIRLKSIEIHKKLKVDKPVEEIITYRREDRHGEWAKKGGLKTA
jgi:hypothetical protein